MIVVYRGVHREHRNKKRLYIIIIHFDSRVVVHILLKYNCPRDESIAWNVHNLHA